MIRQRTLAFSVQTPLSPSILVLVGSSAYKMYCSLGFRMLIARLVNKQEPRSLGLIGPCWIMSALPKCIHALTRFDRDCTSIFARRHARCSMFSSTKPSLSGLLLKGRGGSLTTADSNPRSYCSWGNLVGVVLTNILESEISDY